MTSPINFKFRWSKFQIIMSKTLQELNWPVSSDLSLKSCIDTFAEMISFRAFGFEMCIAKFYTNGTKLRVETLKYSQVIVKNYQRRGCNIILLLHTEG